MIVNKSFFIFVLLVGLCCFTISCTSYERLSNATQKEYDLHDEFRLKKVQFYVDGKFGYEYESTDTKKNISLNSGTARSKEVVEIDRKKIIIDKNTPGVCVGYNGKTIEIDFGNNIIISFRENNVRDNSYWKPSREDLMIGNVIYKYDRSIDNGIPKLVFDGKALRERRINEEERRASGRTLN